MTKQSRWRPSPASRRSASRSSSSASASQPSAPRPGRRISGRCRPASVPASGLASFPRSCLRAPRARTLVAVALATTDAALAPVRWGELVLMLLVGTVPFALLGIALGYWAPARGALPIANLLYLSLSYAGGLWIRPRDLPPPSPAVAVPADAVALRRAGSDRLAGHPFEPGAWVRLAGFAALSACSRPGGTGGTRDAGFAEPRLFRGASQQVTQAPLVVVQSVPLCGSASSSC